MSQSTINQRLNFLLGKLEMKAGAFARALGLSETTIRNYVDRTAKPSSDVLEKISNTFKQVNLVWLITGHGEPIIIDSGVSDTQTTTNAINSKNFSHSQVVTGHANTALNQQQGDTSTELLLAQKEIEHLRAQLASANALIASKDETITLLRVAYHKPN